MTSQVLAQDTNGDGVVTYLLPINVPRPVPGALGTTWRTELWVHNGADQPLQLKGCGDIIPIPGTDCATRYHAAGSTAEAFAFEVGGDERPPAAMLYDLAPHEAGRIVLSSRLFELSRRAQPAGIGLPIVREDELFTQPARFIAVPNDAGFRAALRVYDPRRRGGSVRIEVLTTGNAVVARAVVPLVSDRAAGDVPGMAFITDLRAAFPELRDLPRYDVRVTPLDMAEFWAFVSVTDNDTQQVFTITTSE